MGSGRIAGITIEFDGNTTKLNSSLKDIDKSLKQTDRTLKDVNRLLKFDPKNTELLRQKQQLLAQKIVDTKDRLKQLKEADKQAKQQLDAGTLGKEKYDALQREIESTKGQLKALEKQAKETSSVLGTKMQEAGEKMQKVGDNIQDVGKKFMPVSAGTTAVGVAAGKMAIEFENAMAKVSTIADTTEVPLKDLENSIKDLSRETGISATDIADNVYNAISAGQKTGDAVNFVRESTMLAKAGFADSSATLDVLTTVLNAYGLEAEEVTNVSDMLVQTQNKGKTTVAELSANMGKVIPTAKAQGVALDQVCTSYAIMTSQGIATAESTTYLNSMINELGKSGTTTDKVLREKTGKSFKELMDEGSSLGDVLEIVAQSAEDSGLSMADMFGSAEASKAAITLLGDGADDFNGSLKEMNDSAGATKEAFDKMQTNGDKVQKIWNDAKTTFMELGTSLMEVLGPAIEIIADKVKQFSEWFNSLSDGQKDMIVKIGLVVAAIGPLIMIIGNIASAIGGIISLGGTLATFFSTVGTGAGVAAAGVGGLSLSFLPIAAIVAGVIAVGVLLYKNWDTIKEKATQLKNWLSEKWNNIKEKTSEAWGNMKDKVTEKWNGIKEKTSEVVGNVKEKVTEGWDNLKNKTSETWSNIKGKVEENGGGIKGIIKTCTDSYKNNWKTAFEGINNITGGKLGEALNSAQNKLDSIKNAFKDKMDGAKEHVRKAIDKVKGMFNFSWSLPDIKLPHFSVSGGKAPWGFMGKGSLPSVSVKWYAKAMDKAHILNGAQLFGSMNGNLLGGGEKGEEMVVGKQYMLNLIRKAVGFDGNSVANAVDNQTTQLLAVMNRYFPQFANQRVVLDSGQLVGGLLPVIDSQMGELATFRERGL